MSIIANVVGAEMVCRLIILGRVNGNHAPWPLSRNCSSSMIIFLIDK